MSKSVGLIGYPVEHSISPALQQPAFDRLGIDATYELWETQPQDLESRVTSLHGESSLGANVTAPHKQTVMQHLDEIADSAERAGAVNTIVHSNGRLVGHNTDVFGLTTAIEKRVDGHQPERFVILGAGGAACAAVLAAQNLGATSIAVANRTPASAQKLIEALGVTNAKVVDRDLELQDSLAHANVLINATSVGWQRGEMPVSSDEIDSLPLDTLVVDLVYRDTDLLESARNRGLQALDGLSMLVYQGAKAFELWTATPAPVDVMMEAALQARAANA